MNDTDMLLDPYETAPEPLCDHADRVVGARPMVWTCEAVTCGKSVGPCGTCLSCQYNAATLDDVRQATLTAAAELVWQRAAKFHHETDRFRELREVTVAIEALREPNLGNAGG